jgi:hypothetical protein
MEIKILVPIEATVMLEAPNKGAASLMLEQIFAGERPQPGDLKMEIDREYLLEAFTELDLAIASGIARDIQARSILINRIEER